MTQNHFKPFATGTSAIVQTQEEYEKSAALQRRFPKRPCPIRRSQQCLAASHPHRRHRRRLHRRKSEQDIRDNGDIDTLKQHFETAIRTISSTLAAEAEGTATFTPTLKHLSSEKPSSSAQNRKTPAKPPPCGRPDRNKRNRQRQQPESGRRRHRRSRALARTAVRQPT